MADALRLIGQEWVDHGYQLSPTLEDEPDPCIICGVPMNLCTEDHSNG